MPDILTIWDAADLVSDWLITGDDLASDSGLKSAAIISLLTDRLAGEGDEIPDGSDDRRGWWADDGATEIWGPEAGPIGSHLWLRARAKATEETRGLIGNDCYVALQWMVNIKVASLVTVETWWMGNDRSAGKLGGHIRIYRGPEKAVDLRFEPLWKSLS